MSDSKKSQILSTASRRWSSITLVLVGLIAALVVGLAWPAFDRVVGGAGVPVNTGAN